MRLQAQPKPMRLHGGAGPGFKGDLRGRARVTAALAAPRPCRLRRLEKRSEPDELRPARLHVGHRGDAEQVQQRHHERIDVAKLHPHAARLQPHHVREQRAGR